MMCVYLRTNTVNGKQYVGQANDFKQREQDWKYDSRYSGGVIDKARAKYGIDNFKTDILKECQTQEDLNFWEQYYIKELNTKVPNGYNLTDGGEGCSGYHHTEEEIKKAVESWKKSYNPLHHSMKREEVRKKVSETLKERFKNKENHPNYGKHRSKETKRKLSENNPKYFLGKHHSETTKKKMSETHNREDVKKKNRLNQPTRKEVYQYTLDEEFVRKYDSIAEAAKSLGCTVSEISRCCEGGYFDKTRGKWRNVKTARGYKWSDKPL